MPDRWKTFSVELKGGLHVNASALDLARTMPGAATELLNYEVDTKGGYRRISGFLPYDNAPVPGTGAILGVGLENDLCYAARQDTGTGSTYSIFSSLGAGWASVSTARTYSAVTTKRVRLFNYNLFEPTLVACDGTNPALKITATGTTTLNSTGAPANPKFAALFRSRLVLSGYSARTAGVTLSAPNTDDNFSAGSGAIEFIVGDEVNGLHLFRDELYIFCRNSIKKLVGSTSADFRIENVTDRLGLYGVDSVQEINGDLVFLAPDGIRPISQTERNNDVELSTLSRPIQSIVQNLVSGFGTEEFCSVAIRNKNQYRLFPVDRNNDPSFSARGVTGGLRNAQAGLVWEWGELFGIQPTSAATRIFAGEEVIVHGGNDGYVYRHDQGSTFTTATGSTPILSRFKTPFYDAGDPTIRKVLYKVDTHYVTSGAGTLELSVKYNLDSTRALNPPSVTIDFDSTGVATYGGESVTYGFAVYGATSQGQTQSNIIGSGTTFAFEYAGGFETTDIYTLQTIVIQYNDAGRR